MTDAPMVDMVADLIGPDVRAEEKEMRTQHDKAWRSLKDDMNVSRRRQNVTFWRSLVN